MNIILICIAAFLTALLTFFSGFGLGTILLPVFAVFFPPEIAISLTGVVHFTNNLFKITLVGKDADRSVLVRFGIPAILASFLGARLMLKIAGMPSLFTYSFSGKLFEVTPLKLVIALLLIIFSLLEIIPSAKKIQFSRENLPLGGLLSGFFGGLAGIQGAIRSAFLIKSGLPKEAYIGTGVIIACLVDITRLSVYFARFRSADLGQDIPLLVAATLMAMAGSFLGSRFLHKVTLHFIQILVTVMLILVSIALGAGIV
jgi:uncharacterized membrane protein YfcA